MKSEGRRVGKHTTKYDGYKDKKEMETFDGILYLVFNSNLYLLSFSDTLLLKFCSEKLSTLIKCVYKGWPTVILNII